MRGFLGIPQHSAVTTQPPGILWVDRREFLGIGVALLLPIPQAQAAGWIPPKGAAQLDFEYYLKDLANKNEPQASVKPPPQTARSIDKELVSVIKEVTIAQLSALSSPKTSEQELSERMTKLQSRYNASFQSKSPFPESDDTNSLNLNAWSYCAFKVAGQVLPNSPERAKYIEAVGNGIFGSLKKKISGLRVYDASGGDTTGLLEGIKLLLDVLKERGMMADYRINFGEYEEGDGLPFSILLDVDEPPTIGAFVQLTNENTRFHPDYVGTVLAAYIQACRVKVQVNEFLLDNVYRPDPNEYVATTVLYQITLS
ncbi:unnamed protein product [Chrysoparadoxa australica]